MSDHPTAPQIIWRAFGCRAPEGKTGSTYRKEPANESSCITCAAPISEGVPFAPRRGVVGIDNDTFYGHAEYARWGTHACDACAWLFGDPKRTHRGVLAAGGKGWWPTIAKPIEDRIRWRRALGLVARLPPETPMTGVLTTDPKPRLWPRCLPASVGAPGLYVHSPDHDWSRWTPFDWRELASALHDVDLARALGASKTAIWRGLPATLSDKVDIEAIVEAERRLARWRGTAELMVAVLVT